MSLVVIGTNALAAYMLPTLVPISRHVGVFTSQTGALAPVLRATAVLTAQWLILYWLYRRKIFLRP